MRTEASYIPRGELPRLDLLRTFESAARLLSFTRAADELALTQSAVSRQIQLLEADVGVPLFERRHRAIVLTDAGRVLLRAVADSLERLRDATASLRATVRLRQVSVTTTPGFASLWLIPRLAQFTASHPQVDVRVSATLDKLDLERSHIDLAVRFLPFAQATGTPLFEESLVPVCAPALARDPARPLRTPADLAQHTLLTLDTTHEVALSSDWAPWFEIMGLGDVRMRNTLSFSTYGDAIAAAIAGQGVAIGRLPLLDEILREGRLVAPLHGPAASRRGYFLVRSARAAGNADAADFVDWLVEATGAAAFKIPPPLPTNH